MLDLILTGAMGYLLGAIPTGVLVCRAMRGVDVRQVGSGHTGGLNASRAAGIWGGVLTGVVDLLLGAAAVAGTALLVGSNPWAATIAGAMAVVGHNWSVFIRNSVLNLNNRISKLAKTASPWENCAKSPQSGEVE